MALHFLLDPATLVETFGYFGIFLLMTLESACIPIPSEAVMPLGGFLASQGTLNLWMVIVAGALGNVAGSLVAYAVGYVLEEKVLVGLIEKYGRFVLVSASDYTGASERFRRHGGGITFFSRLLPAVRTFISLPAGMFEMSLKAFIAYTALGSLLWSAALATLGWYLGSQWETIGPYFARFQYAVIACAVLALAYFIYCKLKSRA